MANSLGRYQPLSTHHRRCGATLRRYEAQPARGLRTGTVGCLASFDSTKPRTTRKIYGSVGNSFVAAVEFTTPLRAKASMSGGASGDPNSAHFNDQATRFSLGQFRDVLFAPDDVSAHAERRYHPGLPGAPP
jgi:acyl-homoserine-lactone acylase